MFKFVSLIFVIVIMVTIFLLSAQSAQDSSKLSGDIVDVIIKFAYPHYNDLSYEQQLQIKDKVTLVIRKIAHFTEFTLLGLFLMLHLLAYKPYIETFNLKMFIRVSISFIIGVLYAFSDEIHQSFVAGRYSSIYDVMIDSSGILFGILLIILFFPMFIKNF